MTQHTSTTTPNHSEPELKQRQWLPEGYTLFGSIKAFFEGVNSSLEEGCASIPSVFRAWDFILSYKGSMKYVNKRKLYLQTVMALAVTTLALVVAPGLLTWLIVFKVAAVTPVEIIAVFIATALCFAMFFALAVAHASRHERHDYKYDVENCDSLTSPSPQDTAVLRLSVYYKEPTL